MSVGSVCVWTESFSSPLTILCKAPGLWFLLSVFTATETSVDITEVDKNHMHFQT